MRMLTQPKKPTNLKFVGSSPISPLKKRLFSIGFTRKELSLQTEKGVSEVAPCNNQRQVNLRYLAAPFYFRK